MLDFDYSNNMRSITFKAKFVRSGEYLFDALMFSGTVGIYTGMKPNAFSISINQRDGNSMGETDKKEIKNIAYNILGLFAGF